MREALIALSRNNANAKAVNDSRNRRHAAHASFKPDSFAC